jgi:hypothetical protein
MTVEGGACVAALGGLCTNCSASLALAVAADSCGVCSRLVSSCAAGGGDDGDGSGGSGSDGEGGGKKGKKRKRDESEDEEEEDDGGNESDGFDSDGLFATPLLFG